VIDASVIPAFSPIHPSAYTMLIGKVGSRFIKEDNGV
jgi:hypothetical protein